MPFKKYCSIENSYRQKEIVYLVQAGFSHPSVIWSVSEKIQGANFSFADVSGQDDIRMAKKTSLIATDFDFYGSVSVWKRYEAKIRALMARLKEMFPEAKDFIVFGEIYGGSYPHPDVERVNGATKVQSGVFYNTDNDFYAFDIKVDEVFLDVDVANGLFEEFDFFYAKPLFEGTFQECMEFSCIYKSTIPGRLGLPEIEGENFSEGNVLKPVKSSVYPSGSRVILKNKNPKFNEKSSKAAQIKVEVKMEGTVLESFTNMMAFVNENRLRNVLSHIGPVTQKEFGKIMGEMRKDVIEGFNKDHAEEFKALEKGDRKRVQKIVGQKIADLIRENFVNIIDGNF